MNVELHYNLKANEFLELIGSVGWTPHDEKSVKKAIKNSMYVIKATVDGKLAGMARVVGDNYISALLGDVIVKPEFQKQGVGKLMVLKIDELLTNHVKQTKSKLLLELMPMKDVEEFYVKCGFKYKPEKMMGMYKWYGKDK